jgi:HK97 family phage prohead protease
MLRKTYDIEVKADGEAGEFTALASVFGNVDSVGDRVIPGAFTETLRKLRESGDPLPIVLSHQWDDPFKHIGVAYPENVKQTKRGLLVKGKLDMDNDVARQVYRLMKRRSLKAFSFGYTVDEQRPGPDGVNELVKVDLFEVGPTLVGANRSAELQAVKSALSEYSDAEIDDLEDDDLVGDDTELPEGEVPSDPAPEPDQKAQPDELDQRITDALLRSRGIAAGKENQ